MANTKRLTIESSAWWTSVSHTISKLHPGISITNPPHSCNPTFATFPQANCPTFLPTKKPVAHRARIFITRISFRGPGACLAIHPSEAVERISKSLSEGFVAVAGGQSSSIPRLIWIFPDRMCTACISIPGDTPTNYGRARWPPLEARGTNEEGNGIRGW